MAAASTYDELVAYDPGAAGVSLRDTHSSTVAVNTTEAAAGTKVLDTS
jgi:hypothetical protein